MLERDIEKRVCDYAREKGMLAYKFSSPGHAGVPDRLFIGQYGMCFWIEFKSSTGTLTPLQAREIERLKNHGQSVYVVNDVEQGKQIVDQWSTR